MMCGGRKLNGTEIRIDRSKIIHVIPSVYDGVVNEPLYR